MAGRECWPGGINDPISAELHLKGKEPSRSKTDEEGAVGEGKASGLR